MNGISGKPQSYSTWQWSMDGIPSLVGLFMDLPQTVRLLMTTNTFGYTQRHLLLRIGSMWQLTTKNTSLGTKEFGHILGNI